MARIVAIVPFTICMLVNGCEGALKWISLIIFIAAAITDTLDGYIARRDHLVTDFGKFMDPLADKIIVCAAMICLVYLGRLAPVVCIIIIAREFIISGFRLIASDNGIVIAASMWGKTKTVAQMIMVILLIADFETGPIHVFTIIVVVAATVLTIISLVDYVWKNRQVISTTK